MSTKKRLDEYRRYGWKVNEENLRTLPASAPRAAHDLAKWQTLEGRRSSLQEWINNYNFDTSRIHGQFWTIGAWTHRMSHSNPNQANIPSVFKGKARTGVEEVQQEYNSAMRECFTCPEGAYLVGCDAEGIQLRVLAHLMDDYEYTKAVSEGIKEDGTDAHTVNQKALGLNLCRTRDDAKTFIYAWLLGAGFPKIASILECSLSEAKTAVEQFLEALPTLKDLKEVQIPKDARRGYFIGLDGRKVKQTSAHLMLAGYLQNGEAVIMKRATAVWYWKAVRLGIKFKLVDLVHDEWVVECYSREDADVIGELMCDALEQVGRSLKLKCPLKGEYKVGRTWKDVH